MQNPDWHVRWSWCDVKGGQAHLYKGVRAAVDDLNVSNRNAGYHRGKGASTAVSALTIKQFIRIENMVAQQMFDLEAAKKPLPYLGILKKSGNTWYADYLEKSNELILLDLAKFGGGRAQNDPALYSVRDIYFCENEDAYYVMEGEWRKTTRTGGNGNHIGKGPFCVPGKLAKERMRLLLSGRGIFFFFGGSREREIIICVCSLLRAQRSESDDVRGGV